jgi:hypothetical protein
MPDPQTLNHPEDAMPPEPISELLFHLAARNITTMAWIVGLLLLLGAVLGALRKLATALLSGAFRAGDATASRLAEKPKAALPILAVLALTGACGYAGLRIFPRTVENPVIPLSPESDDIQFERLQIQIDSLHAAGVAREAAMIGKPDIVQRRIGFDGFGQSIYRPVRVRRPDYRNYRSYAHKLFTPGPASEARTVTVAYHVRCAICDRNFHARLKIDAIRERQAREAKARRETQPQTPTYVQKGGLS